MKEKVYLYVSDKNGNEYFLYNGKTYRLDEVELLEKELAKDYKNET